MAVFRCRIWFELGYSIFACLVVMLVLTSIFVLGGCSISVAERSFLLAGCDVFVFGLLCVW
jgi:hypothetical protein